MQLIGINEKRLIDEVIASGYERAASSFSTITGGQVSIDRSSLEIELCTDHNYLLGQLGHLQDLTVIQTQIIGDMSGASYFVLNPEEKETITQMSLAAFGDPRSISEVNEKAVLMEIDNIISAAVITELSNALRVSIYGDVPQHMDFKDISSFHDHLNMGKNDHYLLSHAAFSFDCLDKIRPTFIWEIDKKIVYLASS